MYHHHWSSVFTTSFAMSTSHPPSPTSNGARPIKGPEVNRVASTPQMTWEFQRCCARNLDLEIQCAGQSGKHNPSWQIRSDKNMNEESKLQSLMRKIVTIPKQKSYKIIIFFNIKPSRHFPFIMIHHPTNSQTMIRIIQFVWYSKNHKIM